MTEPGYFERLSQRALNARRHANAPGRRGAAGDSELAALDAATDRLVAQRYRLEKRIGRGRLGDIFEAVDEATRSVGADRRVAIQIVDEKLASNQRVAADLARAYAVLRTSSHPNVVRILDYGTEARQSYVAMDLLEGVSLRSVLEDAAPEPLAADEVWPVILAVGEALQYLHAKGLTHGAVRPESVFITLQYGIKLLDLAPHLPSVAPFYVEDMTKDASAKSDPRDDVYGLACLAYELLTGRHPFNANTPLEARRAGLVPRLLTELDGRDWDAIAAGLELERAQRTPTVQQFLDDLGLTGDERLRVAAPPAEVEPEIAPRPFMDPDTTRDRFADPDVTRNRFTDPDVTRQPSAARSAPPPRAVPLFAQPAAESEIGVVAPVYLEPGAERAPPEREPAPVRPAAPEGRWYLEESRPAARSARSRDDGEDVESVRRWSFFRGVLQATFSFVVIAGLATFAVINFDGLRNVATQAMAAIDERLGRMIGGASDTAEPGRTAPAPGGERTAASIIGSEPEAATETPAATAPTEQPAAPATAVGAQTAAESAAPPAPASTPPAAPAGGSAPAAAAAASGLLAAASAAIEPHRQEESPAVIAVSAPAVSGAPVPTTTEFGFARPIVAVSERESAVAVVIRRYGNVSEAGTVAWWVEADTATADDDYPEFGQKVERFAAGQDSVTVFIPLVRDSLPEQTETFRVYVGRYDSARRHSDATSSMQVEIVDDD